MPKRYFINASTPIDCVTAALSVETVVRGVAEEKVGVTAARDVVDSHQRVTCAETVVGGAGREDVYKRQMLAGQTDAREGLMLAL